MISSVHDLKQLIGIDDYEQEGNDDDFMIALQLQMQMDSEESNDGDDNNKFKTKSSAKELEIYSPKLSSQMSISTSEVSSQSLTDPTWELVDPCPDIRAMFQEFDRLYFWNRLGSCIVEWSKRMTICAGIFYLREGGIIRLSEPLLKYRPRQDLVQTLLHEMIHAYLYLTRNFKDRGDHGDEFKSHMNRINRLANTNITVYHSFHDEVNYQRQHVWRCNGVCRTFPPFYGYVKRSMNRAPGKNDTWWSSHQSKCKGTFEKIAEPEGFKLKQEKKSTQNESTVAPKKEKSTLVKKEKNLSQSTINNNTNKLDAYFNVKTSPNNSTQQTTTKTVKPAKLNSTKTTTNDDIKKIESYFVKKRKLSDDEVNLNNVKPSTSKSLLDKDDIIVLNDDDSDVKLLKQEKIDRECDDLIITSTKKAPKIEIIDDEPDVNNKDLIECPVCFKKLSTSLINSHVNNHFC